LRLQPVADLGDQRLPDFSDSLSKAYPLKLVMCGLCSLLQLESTTPRDELYHERYGFKSGINEAIRRDLESVVNAALDVKPDAKNWLDIACNDGTLLSFVPEDIHRYGVDPLLKYETFSVPASEHMEHATADYFRPSHFGASSLDIVTSVSMFYDLDDPGEFVRGVKSVLARDGVWVIQMNYSLDMLKSHAIDNVGHEHVTYFGVRPLGELLAHNGMDIFEVSYSPVNGGCFRAMACHRGRYPIQDSVDKALAAEYTHRLSFPETWRLWYEIVTYELEKTREFLEAIQESRKQCYLYGASTRVGTILQLIDAGPGLVQQAVERNPEKVGKLMSSTGIPVISEEEMRIHQPEYLLIGPWFFRDVFVERERSYLENGGAMIFSLPRFEVVRA